MDQLAKKLDKSRSKETSRMKKQAKSSFRGMLESSLGCIHPNLCLHFTSQFTEHHRLKLCFSFSFTEPLFHSNLIFITESLHLLQSNHRTPLQSGFHTFLFPLVIFNPFRYIAEAPLPLLGASMVQVKGELG
ncbi:hypothetical protein LR48_Vigan05g103800 [Vigna angularis]|uniref:Uncharacterized protein n=1 Tax=Phaseolus angularis TaxID=3914 RepID=A0A0L9ULK7_PHAAN|nr:hypothetical protein LR48_Vigan05g103800 [Vigna angularis]